MGVPTVDVVNDSIQAAQLAAQTTQLAISGLQLSTTIAQLVKLGEIVAGGTQIGNILRDSQAVLQGIQEDIKKSQEIIGPFVALVVEVEKIGQIIKGDVGLNLSSLVDATIRISNTLQGTIAPNISDAIDRSASTVATEITKTADATASVAAKTEAGAQTIAAAIAKANVELISRTLFGAFTPEAIARVSQMAICHKEELAAHPATGPVEGLLETITKSLVCIFQTILQPVIEAGSKTADVIFRPVTTTIVGALNDIFAQLGEADPNRVTEVGGTVLAKAIELGMAAHGLAVIAEAAYPTKNLGLPQIAAFLVDVSGFKVVGDAVVGEQIRAVLRQPMHYRSNFLHRPNLPELRDAMQAWRKLAFSDADFARLVRFHGYPDTFIPFFEQVATLEPRVRELALVFDDVETDESWLTRALQRAGYRGDDVDKLHRGIAARANKTFRQNLIAELISQITDGLHDIVWLRENLRAQGLRPQTITLITTHAQLKLTREHTKELAQVWQTKAEQEVITVLEYRVALIGLGFTTSVVSAKVALVDAKLRGKVVKQEKAQIESVVRKVQAERSQQAIQLFRRGILSEDQLHAVLAGLGFVEAQARALVDLESAKRLPAHAGVTNTAEQATLRKVLAARVDAVVLLLRHERIDADQAFASLVALGLDPELAAAEVEKELARLKLPKSVLTQTPA